MLVHKTRKLLEKKNWLCPNDKVLVGFSGGVDSTALLHLLSSISSEFMVKCYAVHINHGLRDAESDKDEAHAREFCEAYAIDLIVKSVDVKNAIDSGSDTNVQSVARALRYDALREVADELGCNKLFLAHHSDDQAETVLWRILRGTGIEGLAGIKPHNFYRGLQLIRPLLKTSKEELEQYCYDNDLGFRNDSSNASPKYTRNRLRLELLPALDKYNPNIRNQLCNMAEIMRAEAEEVGVATKIAADKVTLAESSSEKLFVDLVLFREYSIAVQRRVLKLLLEKLFAFEVSFDFIESLRSFIHNSSPSASMKVFKDWKIERDYDRLNITLYDNKVALGTDNPLRLDIPGNSNFHGKIMGTIRSIISDSELDASKLRELGFSVSDFAFFDYAKLTNGKSELELYVRTRLPGDKMTCLGMTGTKKVKNLLIDSKVSRNKRDSLPLILLDNKIIWIPSVQRSNIACVDQNTAKRVYLIWCNDT